MTKQTSRMHGGDCVVKEGEQIRLMLQGLGYTPEHVLT